MKTAKKYSKKSVESTTATSSNLFLQGIIEGLKNLTESDFEHYVKVKLDYYPKNIFSNIAYKRFNSLALLIDVIKRHYSVSKYATFQQIKEAGGILKKGSKSVPLQYFNYDVKHKVTKQRISIEDYRELTATQQEQYTLVAFAKYFRVFNINCIENLADINIDINDFIDENASLDRNEIADAYINKLQEEKGLVLNHELKTVGSYNFVNDIITMPLPEYHTDASKYYTTLFHEIIHWTGHESRLNREKATTHGDAVYSNEELIAEIGSMILANQFNFNEEFINSLKYLKNWINNIADESSLEEKLSEAFKQANKAISYLGR